MHFLTQACIIDKFNALQTHSLKFADGIHLTELFTMQGREMGWIFGGDDGCSSSRQESNSNVEVETNRQTLFCVSGSKRPVCSSGGTSVCWVPSTCHLALIRINLFANFRLCLETQHLVKLNFGQGRRIVATFSKAFGYPIWLKSLWDWVTIEINPSFKITNKAIKRGVKLNQSEH